jgi:hypothetical protein
VCFWVRGEGCLIKKLYSNQLTLVTSRRNKCSQNRKFYCLRPNSVTTVCSLIVHGTFARKSWKKCNITFAVCLCLPCRLLVAAWCCVFYCNLLTLHFYNRNCGNWGHLNVRSVCTPACFSNIGRFHPFIGHEGLQGEQSYSSTLFLTLALEGGEGSASLPGRTLPPGKTRYPLYRRLGGPQGQSGQVRKMSPPPAFDPWTVQPVGSRYTDYATQPTTSRT